MWSKDKQRRGWMNKEVEPSMTTVRIVLGAFAVARVTITAETTEMYETVRERMKASPLSDQTSAPPVLIASCDD